jgi:hypothetical protein
MYNIAYNSYKLYANTMESSYFKNEYLGSHYDHVLENFMHIRDYFLEHFVSSFMRNEILKPTDDEYLKLYYFCKNFQELITYNLEKRALENK